MPDSFGRLGSAALINSNIQQITISPACNRSEGEVGSAKSFSLSDLGHEILPELSQEKTRQKRLQMQIQILTKGTEAL